MKSALTEITIGPKLKWPNEAFGTVMHLFNRINAWDDSMSACGVRMETSRLANTDVQTYLDNPFACNHCLKKVGD